MILIFWFVLISTLLNSLVKFDDFLEKEIWFGNVQSKVSSREAGGLISFRDLEQIGYHYHKLKSHTRQNNETVALDLFCVSDQPLYIIRRWVTTSIDRPSSSGWAVVFSLCLRYPGKNDWHKFQQALRETWVCRHNRRDVGNPAANTRNGAYDLSSRAK